MEQIGFVIACRDYFGMKQGETLMQFGAEVKALTPEDRTELAPMLSRELGKEVSI